ncbi:MAG: TPM domain-containing protein [bacterium]|nr:TPM domain-containing protein [bacterium]
MRCLIALLLLLPAQTALFAREIPFLSGHVIDEAGALGADVREELEAELARHAENTSNQIVVMIIPSLEGEVLEQFSLRAAETYGLGQADKDNGVLLLIAQNDRKLRIEVGYGLEGSLTDALSAQIIRNEIVPRFRDGEFEAGVVAGVDAILQAIQGEYTAEDSAAAQAATAGETTFADTVGQWVSKIFTFIMVAGFMIYAAYMGFGMLIAIFQRGLFSESWWWFIFIGPLMAIIALIPVLVLWDGAPGLASYIVVLALLAGFKAMLHTTRWGRDLRDRFDPGEFSSGSSGSSSSAWSGSSSSGYSSSSSSSSSGFSGGGGSFGGGGSSGSW